MVVFTPEEVRSINEFQESGVMHPFTCGSGHRLDERHTDGEGRLVATEEGLKCPFCEYRQNWAHDFVKDGRWRLIALKLRNRI